MSQKTALITGASGGLGEAFARLCAADGYELLLTARKADKLAALKAEIERAHPVRVETLSLDLALPDAVTTLWAHTEEKGLDVQLLINNAGFGDFGPFAASDWARQAEMIQLNVAALAQLTHVFLAPMMARGAGRILNVASLAAFQPGPLMSVYYASKAFVLHFSEALAVETRGTGVTLTALCPGPTQTGFKENGGLANSGLFRNFKIASAEAVARYGYRQLMRGKPVAIHGWRNKLLAFSVRFAPRSLSRELAYRFQK